VVVTIQFLAEQAEAVDREKLGKELAEVDLNLERVRARLANPGFTDKAPPAVIEGAWHQLSELETRRATLEAALAGQP
jgi:valyl-tRNA synthetase